MKTFKKSLSVFLAVLMMFSVCCVGFATFAAESTPVDRIDITLKTDIAGKKSSDYKDIYTIDTENVVYDDSVEGYDALYIYDEYSKDAQTFDEAVEAGKKYDFKFCVAAEEGYSFPEEVEIYINDEKAEIKDSGITSGELSELNTLYFVVEVAVDEEEVVVEPLEVIGQVDIELDVDIAGKTSSDYKDIYKISTDHVVYDDSVEGSSGLYFKLDDADYTEAVKAGKMYVFGFRLAAEEGYCFDENTKIYINGALIEPENLEAKTDEETGVSTLTFEMKQVIDGGFLAKLITAITDFVNKIVDFFNAIFKSPAPTPLPSSVK